MMYEKGLTPLPELVTRAREQLLGRSVLIFVAYGTATLRVAEVREDGMVRLEPLYATNGVELSWFPVPYLATLDAVLHMPFLG